MSKHTPGPWIVNAEQVFGNGYKIAAVNDAGHNWQEDRDLIAAAPDLLAALKGIVAGVNDAHDSRPLIRAAEVRAARAAIAKAEGAS